MKKFLLIGLAAAGLMIAAAPRSEAGVSVGIGFGGPVGYYPYGSYGCGYPYGYGYYPSYYRYYRPRAVIYRPYHWYHGRRVYYARRHW